MTTSMIVNVRGAQILRFWFLNREGPSVRLP
jgi:hypothetical protein